MVKPARRPARYDELLKVPDTKVAEIIDGELIVSPRPASPHAFAASMIGADLIGGFHGRDPGGWWFLIEPEFHFGDDVLVPDIAGWCRTTMPTVPNVAAFTEAPDWVCEVISPSTGRIDRGRKTRIYAREAVSHLWFVEPLLHTVEVYRLRDGNWTLATVHDGDDRVRIEPFEDVELDPSRWWLPGV